MYSRNHALVSAVVGVPLAVAAGGWYGVALWAWVVALGVGIDVDHFALAIWNGGGWENVGRVRRDPTIVVTDPGAIFDPGDLYRDQRLFTHSVIGGVLVAVIYPLASFWAFATAVTVYAHVLADLYSDMRTRDAYLAGEH